MQDPLRAARALSVLAAVLGVGLMAVLPHAAELAPGWRTPVVALELARTPEDLAFLSDPVVRRGLLFGHLLDVPFPIAYGLLLVALGTAFRARWTRWAGWAVIPLDLLENAVLTRLLLDYPDVSSLLPLFVATWAKWGAIGLAFIGLAVRIRATRPALTALLGGCAALVPLALLTGRPWAGEAMGIGVTVGFVGAMSLAFLPRHAGAPAA